MKAHLLLLLFGLLLAVSACSEKPGGYTQAEQSAIDAATKWLSLVDAGNHPGSWEQAAPYFKGAVSSEAWTQTMAAARVPLGGLVSREVKSAEHTTSLPGAPDGEYVVIQFETSFENKASATETVTPMLGEDGTWRVSGYYIK
ncbi:MAG: DUF4019 domain-containing protein [bacterium]|jgi:hypothetical protein